MHSVQRIDRVGGRAGKSSVQHFQIDGGNKRLSLRESSHATPFTTNQKIMSRRNLHLFNDNSDQYFSALARRIIPAHASVI
jgi:hypothetical protein